MVSALEWLRAYGRRVIRRYSERRAAGPWFPIGECPCCGLSLEDHVVGTLATAVLGTPEEAALVAALRARRWADSARHHEFDVRGDNVVVYLIRCGSGDVGLAEVVSPFELDADDYARHSECLGPFDALPQLRALRVPWEGVVRQD